jgi:hypothetical protein
MSKRKPRRSDPAGFFVSASRHRVHDAQMNFRSLALAACGLLAACGSAENPAADPSPTVAREAAEASAPAPAPASPAEANLGPSLELAGDYRIAGVDGADIDLPHGISATIGADRIDVVSQCVEMAWSYRLDGTALQTTRLPVVSCDRARYPEEEAIEAAFTAAREVERTESNGIRFSGGGRSVILFSQ